MLNKSDINIIFYYSLLLSNQQVAALACGDNLWSNILGEDNLFLTKQDGRNAVIRASSSFRIDV